jgi:hypothetical protein
MTTLGHAADDIHLRVLTDLAKRLRRQALLARNGGFNPLAEQQAGILDRQAGAVEKAMDWHRQLVSATGSQADF